MFHASYRTLKKLGTKKRLILFFPHGTKNRSNEKFTLTNKLHQPPPDNVCMRRLTIKDILKGLYVIVCNFVLLNQKIDNGASAVRERWLSPENDANKLVLFFNLLHFRNGRFFN